MCDAVSSITILLPYSGFKSSNNSRFRSPRNGGSQLISACFGKNSLRIVRNSIPTGSGEYGICPELGFKDIGKEQFELETERGDEWKKEKSRRRRKTNDIDDDNEGDGLATSSSGINFAEFKDESEIKSEGRLVDEDLIRPETERNEIGLKLDELEQSNGVPIAARRRGRQLIKRSNLLAKQVISIQSALSLGFVSQLWVDTLSVRPSLLSGETERFFLEDITQVGDVVLIQDEGVMENDMQMVGLETLVGYNVITPGRRNIGKVRGYTFNINSGAVESLELDSFGISIIPSSLVSTYALLAEDVLEVVSDSVVVHEAAALRIQRLTKGFWDSQKLGSSIDELEDYPVLERPSGKFDKGGSRRRTFTSRKFGLETRAGVDDWEHPKDYL